MLNNISKNQNEQIPSLEGRAAEATASITNLVKDFFDETSFDESEDVLSDLIQMYVNPDPNLMSTKSYISDVIFSVRRVTNLIRKLEVANDQLKGGPSC